jgi:beta-lactamase regulating signal transducer with metallopeptidase domain
MERMLMEYLVNSLWQVPVLAAGAWLVLRAGRPGPRVQHGVWVAVLGLMVAMPLLSLRGANVAAPVAAPAVVLPEVESVGVQDVLPVVATASDFPKAAEVPAPWLRMREVRLSAAATHRVVELYLAVILFAMVRLLWSWVVARRMVGEAVAAELSDAELALLGACCERLGVRRPEVLVSGRTSSPLVVGVLRPVLLLPERFAEDVERDGREMEAVWWHELAHVRRRDYLANLVCRIWAVPVAYHPATYAVERRVRQTREMVCDRMAAEEMESPVGYARCLVGLAQRMQAGELQGTAMFGGGVLEERVTELIGTKLVESVRVRVVRAASAVAMLAAVMGLAAMFHVTPTMAQAVVASAVDSAVLPLATAPIPASASAVAEPAQVLPAERMAPVVDAEADRRDARAVRAAIEGVRKDAVAAQVDEQSGADDEVKIVDGCDCGDYQPRVSEDLPRDVPAKKLMVRLGIPPAPFNRLMLVAGSAKAEQHLAIPDADRLQLLVPEFMRSARQRILIAAVQPPAPVQDAPPATPVAPVQPSPHPKALAQPKPAAEPAAPRAPKAPLQPDAPPAPKVRLKPLAPMPPVAPLAPVAPVGKGAHVDGFDGELQPDMQLKLDKEMGAASEQLAEARKQMKEAMEKMNTPEFKQQFVDAQKAAAKINTPEFQKQIAEGQRRAKEAMEKMNTPEFRQQFADAQKAAAKINTPEFQKQIAEAQGRAKEAMERMNTPEFKQQFADAQKAAAKINTPEFRKQMEEAQRQMKEAMEKMNSPEFRKQLEDAQRQAKEAGEKMNTPEFKKQMQEMWAEPKHPDSTENR